MLVIDVRVQNIIRECEDRIRAATNDNSISVVLFSKKIALSLSFDDVVDFVCAVTGEKAKDITKVSRKKEIVTARQLVIYFSFQYCSLSKSEIARRLNQDHTTILKSLKTVDDLLQTGDQLICNYVNEVNNIIQSLTKSNDRPATTRTPDVLAERSAGIPGKP